jgi:hypothetical protein
MTKALVEFWSKFQPQPNSLNIHPHDLEWFKRNGWDVENQSRLTFNSFIRSNRFGVRDNQLHLSLLPIPFVGNLEKAKVFILLMNPGLSKSDYYAEEVPEFQTACIRNLRQSNGHEEFPFFYLNPKFAWSGGFMWWEALLRPITKEMMRLRREQFPTYYSALEFLAKQIAAVELVPYHSVGGEALPGKNVWKDLPSAKHAREFVQRLGVIDEPPLVLVLRSHERWGLGSNPDGKFVSCPVTRRPTLNPNLDGDIGKAGSEFLAKLGLR